MGGNEDIIEKIRGFKRELSKNLRIDDMLVFGSTARGEMKEDSGKKYSSYFGKEYRGPFEITDISRMKKKRINVGGQWWVSAHAELTISAEPEMLRFLWDAGIGSKNSQGFGCLKYEE